jgi:hypothetical protein
MIRLDDLEAKARAATQGGWVHVNHGDYIELDPEDEHSPDGPIGMGTQDKNRTNNASFIASANPETVLALIKVARAAKDMIKEWEDSYEDHGFLFSVEVETRIKEAMKGVE